MTSGDDDIAAAPGFCGPENINLDNPNNGEEFVIT